MAIAVTGAYGQVSTLACRRLAGTPIEVLALKQDDWADAIGESEAVIHLAGTVQPKGRNSYDSVNDQTTAEVGATNAAFALGDYQCDTQRDLGPTGGSPVSGASWCSAPLLLQQQAGEQAERHAEDRVADPPAPVRRRAIERVDLLRVDDSKEENRVNRDAVSGPEHGRRSRVRPSTEDRGQ